MKKALLVFLIFVSFAAIAQKKDSLPPKPDSVQVIMNEFLIFLQDKLTVKEYVPVQQMVNAYLKSKEFTKPKK